MKKRYKKTSNNHYLDKIQRMCTAGGSSAGQTSEIPSGHPFYLIAVTHFFYLSVFLNCFDYSIFFIYIQEIECGYVLGLLYCSLPPIVQNFYHLLFPLWTKNIGKFYFLFIFRHVDISGFDESPYGSEHPTVAKN